MAFKREIQGVVVKIAGEKTASILVERKVVHPRYRKIVKRFKKYLIHDERNEVKVGDTVVAEEDISPSDSKTFHLQYDFNTGCAE